MQYSEQPAFINDSDIDITSDINVISYDQYLKETENEVVQDTTSHAQQDALIMSVIEEMSNQKFDLKDREKYIDGQMRGVIVDRNAKFDSYQKEIQMLKLQLSANIESNKVLNNQMDVLKKEFFEKQDKYIEEIVDLENKKKALDNIVFKTAQRKQHALYYDNAMVRKHDALSVIDTEETLNLTKESKFKMNAKQNNPIAKEKKVTIAPIDYAALNT
ncbi:hypothetical protein Tco_1079122 [Tanacetum coccineum]|uniref:Uncharacterized protein n=1 Tax=Tanacetum coccineum TaxID=301880 RepID=A0ABQ5HSF9_9ASTR